MSETAIARAVRTFDLIPYILNNPGVSIRELAQEFNADEKQISDDLQIAFMCGLPGYTPYELIELQVSDGYVTVREPQVLDKPRSFSASEQLALSLGLQMIENSTNKTEIRLLISNLIRKLNISNIAKVALASESINAEILNTISKSISKKTVVNIVYLSKLTGQQSERDIYPYRVYLENGMRYLEAFCLRSQGNRTFAVANILQALATAKNFDTYPDSKETEIDVSIRCASDMQLFLEQIDRLVIERGVTKNREFPLSAKLKISNIDWLVRTIQKWGGKIQIESPAELKEKVRKLAIESLANYEKH